MHRLEENSKDVYESTGRKTGRRIIIESVLNRRVVLSLQSSRTVFPEFLFSLARREKGERSDEVCEDRAIADSMGGEFNERTRVNSPRDANGWKIKLEERKKNARRRQSRGNKHGW